MGGYLLWVQGRRKRVPDLLSPVQEEGYRVIVAISGRQALSLLEEQREAPDLVVLYLAAMGSSGTRLLRQFHQALPKTPLLLIVPEDFSLKENLQRSWMVTLHLPLRPRTFLRRLRRLVRPPAEPVNWHRIGPIWYDPVSFRVRIGNREQILTPLTFRLLRYLMEHPGRVIPYEELFQAVWGVPSNGDLRTLQVHICWLRKVLEKDPKRPRFLRTVRGKGYLWSQESIEDV